MQRIPGVNTTDVQGNGLFQDLRYRGFSASPLQGTPQGLAVYMNGIRINEAFGDTVNWDFIPTVAVGRADIWTNNPAFGLNALGGAISFQMKDGFTYQGFEFDALGGSYGRIGGSFQYGVRQGEWALYMAGEGVKDDGWRYQSPSRIGRFYGDLGRKTMDSEIHLVATAADNYFGVVGPTPVEMLNRDWRSIYTWPQTTKNQAQILSLNGRYSVTDNWTVQNLLYVRNFKQFHVDGNDADVERCAPGDNTLCLDEDALPNLTLDERRLRDQFGNAINCPPGPGNTCRLPWGTVDRTSTRAVTVGGSLQATNDDKIFGRDNHFTIGASYDHSRIGFGGDSELGYIYPDFFVGPNGPITGTGVILHTDAYIGYAPVDLSAKNTYYGLYASNTYDITSRLSLTAGARYNLAKITTEGQSRHQPRPQWLLQLPPDQSGVRPDAEDCAGADLLCRLFGSQPRADAARTRLLQSGAAVPDRRLPGVRPAAAAGHRAHARGRPARPVADQRRAVRLEGRPVPHRQFQRHHQRRQPHPRPRRVPERRRAHAARAWRRPPNTGRKTGSPI